MNNQIDNILDRLQKQQPELQDPELLADSIIAVLPDRPKESIIQPVSRYKGVILFMHTVSSVAAVLLLVLFLWQSYDGIDLQETVVSPDYSSQLAKYQPQFDLSKDPAQQIAQYQERKQELISQRNQMRSILSLNKTTH